MQVLIHSQHHRSGGRRHGDLIGSHRGLGETVQGEGRVVPFGEIADQVRHILRAVVHVRAGAAVGHVRIVADKDDYGHAVAVGAVDGHGRVLQPHRAVHVGSHGLAFDLGVTVGHGDGSLFVKAG